MYGSIRKNYGAKKASSERETRSFFGKKKVKNFDVKNAAFQETSYINVENCKNGKTNKDSHSFQHSQQVNNSTKSEFPIASVILTIVFTMMVMVLAFGLGGV